MQIDARLPAYAVEQLVRVGRLAERGGRECREVGHTELTCLGVCFLDDVVKLLLPLRADGVILADLVQQRRVPALVCRRHGSRAGLGVHDKQVHGVGPDVQNAQPHERTLRVDTLRHLGSPHGPAGRPRSDLASVI